MSIPSGFHLVLAESKTWSFERKGLGLFEDIDHIEHIEHRLKFT